MSKVKTFGTLAVLALALTAMVIPVAANLVPTTFGFPVIVQNGSTSAFNQDTARATDFENINIDWPISINNHGQQIDLGPSKGPLSADGVELGCGATSNILPFGPVNLAFPSIDQTVIQTQDVTHTDFAQTNEFAEFAYPFVGVGPVCLPGFGFGF